MCFSRQGVFSNTPLRVGLILGGSLAMLLLLIWAGNLFATLRLRLQDVYFIPAPVSGQVTIVALDDASMEAYGRTPAEWSRTVFADLLQALGAAGAAGAYFLMQGRTQAAPVVEEDVIIERRRPRYEPTCHLERRRVWIDEFTYTYRRVEVCQ